MGLIPENILDEILNRTDIVELISGYIPLKKAGRNFKSVCPFHHEKTPSFIISPDKQIYHCFGCSVGGNAIGFLMQYEKLEFREAIEILAKKANVILPKEQTSDSKEGFIQKFFKINELASEFYQQNLNSKKADFLHKYLTQRGINEKIIKEFKLGYAPEQFDSLINYLRTKNISLDLIEKAGLIIPKEKGGYYDRFRNRLIFPIFDVKNRVIAFGARILDEHDKNQAKYINSPETPIYIKGKNLYGLNFTKGDVLEKDFVVIVEGYLDFITPYTNGIKNIVASLGTALTEEQVRLLKRFTNNVVMSYDSDQAGQLATLRSLDLFIEEGMSVKIAGLPESADPDSFVRKFGPDKFKALIEDAGDLFDYKINLLKKKFDVKDIHGKTKIASGMLETINKIKNSIIKSEYIKKLSEELKIKEEDLLSEIKKIKNTPDFRQNLNISRTVPTITPLDKMLIKLMLDQTHLILNVSEVISPTDFQDMHLCEVMEKIFDLARQGKEVSPAKLLNYLSNERAQTIISELTTIDIPETLDREKALLDCVERIQKRRLKFKQDQLHEEIKLAQSLKDESRLTYLIKEFNGLVKQELKKND